MIELLNTMHDDNPPWGPLFVVQPGDISRDLAYSPFRTAETETPMTTPRVPLRSPRLNRRKTRTMVVKALKA